MAFTRAISLAAALLVVMCTPAGATDQAGQLALDQTLRLSSSFTNRKQAESWLSAMSSRLEPMVADPFYRLEILRLAHEAARVEGLDPQLVLALIQIESRFDRFAVSVSGARGLMQVMPFWMKEIGHPADDLFYPSTNLRYGCQILKHYLRSSGNNVRTALARYNGGGDPHYATKVLAAFKGRWAVVQSSRSGKQALVNAD